MDEIVLREIIARIMSDPRLQPLLAAATANSTQKKDRSIIVVQTEEGLRALPELQRDWTARSELSICLAGPVSYTAANLSQLSCDQAMQSVWDRMLIPVCSVQQLGEIVLGFRRDKLTDLVAWAILQGIPVEIGRIDYGFTEKTPAAYRQRLEDYAEQAEAYGIKIGHVPSCPATLPAVQPDPVAASLPWSYGEQVKPVEPESRSAITYDKGLMTEKEALLLPEHAVLMLKKSTVLTPSAIDLLKRQKIQVFKEGVRFL